MYADGFSKFRFGGYGEMAASYMDYDWNWVDTSRYITYESGYCLYPSFYFSLCIISSLPNGY